jgi:hypothetical protein
LGVVQTEEAPLIDIWFARQLTQSVMSVEPAFEVLPAVQLLQTPPLSRYEPLGQVCLSGSHVASVSPLRLRFAKHTHPCEPGMKETREVMDPERLGSLMSLVNCTVVGSTWPGSWAQHGSPSSWPLLCPSPSESARHNSSDQVYV